ncbi:MAG: T9SS type A sorting domain-containing protein [Bacteroidales bacterium]|nr:T9SS type A sorting domain-containing protein [Bacteroidales bacterium]HOY38201.1 T9SS type A sorting domain-containing protein [Bacteroidales bacterium]HQP03004.1 T9SS type A sorting domain-containing protein [Bacteroidales bacterium]
MKKCISIVFFIFWANVIISQTPDSAVIICPSQSTSNDIFPVVVRLYKNGALNYAGHSYSLAVTNATAESSMIVVKKGVGSLCTKINTSADFQVEVQGFSTIKNVNHTINDPIEISGYINSDYQCIANTLYYVSSDLTIQASQTLTIYEGAQLIVAENANIICHGKIICDANTENPIVFKSDSENIFWGGITITSAQDTSVFEHVFFIKGGGNTNFIFGHSGSQPVLKADNGNMICRDCYFIDNTGKALGGNYANISLKQCLISRCDTGGEFFMSKVDIDSCYVMNIPDDDGIIEDDDNDCFYFNNVHSSNSESKVSNSFFITGEDDAIDHNGAKLSLENCWIQDFYHEGIAGSNGNYVSLHNSVVVDCGQGIEAGYGSPHVMANHCVFAHNGVGARFGDDYVQPSEGKMIIKNSIFFDNTDNLLNWEPQTGGPVTDSLEVMYSITNDIDFDGQNSCIAGTPQFSQAYLLEIGSPGSGAADDGLDMGLISSLTMIGQIMQHTSVQLYPNPVNTVAVFDFDAPYPEFGDLSILNMEGKILLNRTIHFDTGINKIEQNVSFLKPGLYQLVVVTPTKVFSSKFLKLD